MNRFDYREFYLFFRAVFTDRFEGDDRYDKVRELLWCDSLSVAHSLSNRVFQFSLLHPDRKSRSKRRGDVWDAKDILNSFLDMGGELTVVGDDGLPV